MKKSVVKNTNVDTNLVHPLHRNCAERAKQTGLDTRRRLEHENAAGTQQVHRNLQEHTHQPK